MERKEVTIQYIKSLGDKKNRSRDTLLLLKRMFLGDYKIEIKREIVSSIGRQTDNDGVFRFVSEEAFKGNPMELVYQIYRTCLYKGKEDIRFYNLGEKIRKTYNNENIEKMYAYYNYRQNRTKRVRNIKGVSSPLLLVGDTETPSFLAFRDFRKRGRTTFLYISCFYYILTFENQCKNWLKRWA